jgi:hypothetical protein
MDSRVIHQHQPVVVTAEAVLNQIGRDEGDFLLLPLFAGVLLQVAAFGCEAHAEGRARQGRNLGQYVRVFE